MSAEEILRLDDRRYEAMRRHDVETLAELLHREVTYTHSDAAFDSKETYLAKVKGGIFRYHFIEPSNRSVTVVGDTALVHGRMRADADVNGMLRHIDNFALAVWVRDEGQWTLLAYQPTVLPKVAG
jgi:ketosteroid isomerase-like protein